MEKKYQIFVSSTYIDLKEQREQVVKTVLRMGHLPVGMEMFDAADDSQWETIKKHIDNSDYYLLIIAHRYGSEDSDGIGFTEKEYNYALNKGIPCIAFIIDSAIKNWNNDFIDAGKKKIKLSNFKNKFKNKLINFWSSTDNLALQVSHSLSTLFTNKPGIGWIRGSEAANPLVAEEISRLSKENNELKQLVLSQSTLNNPIQKAYDILGEINYDLNFFDHIFSGSYLELFHLSRELLLDGSYIHLFYMQIFSKLTGREMFEVNQLPDRSISIINQKEILEFIDRIVVLRLVEQSLNNKSQSASLNLTEKGKELILKIEYPD